MVVKEKAKPGNRPHSPLWTELEEKAKDDFDFPFALLRVRSG